MDQSPFIWSMPPLAPLPTEKTIHKALYAEQDRRKNILDLDPDDPVRQKTSAIGCLILSDHLEEKSMSDNYILEPDVPSLSTFLSKQPTLKGGTFSPTENFSSEPVAGFGTAFLVAKDLLLTAAHCVCQYDKDQLKTNKELAKISIVFNFTTSSKIKTELTILKNDVFSIKRVVAYQLIDGVEDWALIQLTEAVSQATQPLELGFESPTTINSSVYMLGHPYGLPMKYAPSGTIVEAASQQEKLFSLKIDSFAGNSGSPIFDEEDGKVLGILIRGQEDYHIPDIKTGAIQPYKVSDNSLSEIGQKLSGISHKTRKYIEASRKEDAEIKAKALYELGLEIYDGQFVKKDLNLAYQAFITEEVKNHFLHESLYNAGLCLYEAGSFKKALKSFGESKDPRALVARGVHLIKEEKTPENIEIARKLFQAALSAGYQAAQECLDGLNTQKDEQTEEASKAPPSSSSTQYVAVANSQGTQLEQGAQHRNTANSKTSGPVQAIASNMRVGANANSFTSSNSGYDSPVI